MTSDLDRLLELAFNEHKIKDEELIEYTGKMIEFNELKSKLKAKEKLWELIEETIQEAIKKGHDKLNRYTYERTFLEDIQSLLDKAKDNGISPDDIRKLRGK